jgi:hypothetical protein
MSMREACWSAERWREGDDRPPLFRSGWEIAAMVAGFVVFWPVGLAVLGFLFWRRHKMRDGWTGEGFSPDRAMAKAERAFSKAMHKMERRGYRPSSGNAAFDDYRMEVMRRLEEERRKLDEEQKAFGEFMLRLKRAKDQEEFDRFMADRNGAPGAGPAN